MGTHRSIRRSLGAAAIAVGTIGLTAGAAGAIAPGTGPSSSQTPYLVPVASGVAFQSILTTHDTVPLATGAPGTGPSFKFAGIADGMGAFDNGDGTYTLLVNHEIPAGLGVDRPGDAGIGAFVDRLVIDKSSNAVVSGRDLISRVFLYNPVSGTYAESAAVNFNRFCSADLPAVSAFYNQGTGLGTQARIYMNGEEGGTDRSFAHIVTGGAAGDTYELPRFGKQAWENALANPATGDKTVVMLNDDTTPSPTAAGNVFLYLGTKGTTGTDVDKAGLTNGNLFVVKVDGVTAEDRTHGLSTATDTFAGTVSFAGLGDVSSLTSAQLETQAIAGGTSFLRPEDGVWDPQNPNVYYFQTTDRLDTIKDGIGTQAARSRLWKLSLNDRLNPGAGGTIEALLDGTEAINMLDNLTADGAGHLILLEDVGGADHNGKVWRYDLATDSLTLVAKHDPARFGDIGVTPTAPYNNDEETSGVIPAFDILGPDWYLIVDQAHNTTGPRVDTETVEDGQLLAMYIPPGLPANVPEAPYAVLLPLGALCLIGGCVLVLRRQPA